MNSPHLINDSDRSQALRFPGSLAGFVCAVAFLLTAVVGCEPAIDRFETNQLYGVSLSETRHVATDTALRDVEEVVVALFGTPGQPKWPVEFLGRELIADVGNLERAVGKVSSNRTDRHKGLYREHCVICHGIAGSGAGAASLFQDPYPRDFRHGVFKWKSTLRESKPTRDDLLKLLQRGVPGTAMPSFRLLSLDDLEALVDYTIYLSVRGEAERELLAMAVDELGYDSEAPEGGLGFSEALTSDGQLTDSESAGVVREVLGEIAQEWGNASSQEAPVLPVPAGVVALSGRTAKTMTWNEDAVRRGEAIFHGPIANCVGCHGKAGRADVVTLDYDDWTKEYTTRIGITPTDKDAIRPLRKLGAMPPRQIRPRRLADQVYHGDETPESVYRRITQGIAGTPMPAVLITEEPSPTGLTGEQVWDLVSYVMSLGRNANTTETALR